MVQAVVGEVRAQFQKHTLSFETDVSEAANWPG